MLAPSAETLVTNTYDQAYSGYYNVGKLTTSVAGDRTELFFYGGTGKVNFHEWRDAGQPTRWVETIHDRHGEVLYKTCSDGFSVGSATNYWQYDAFGRLKSIPGYIADQTYELDGQTKTITYANG